MDKHKLGEILQALPDGFGFKAVLEEAIKEKEKKCKVAFEESSEQTQAQILQANQGYLESKEQELWEDIQESLEWLLWADVVGFVPEDDKVCHYDKDSRQWVDYESYWGARIKEQLESSGIFMSEDEFASMLDMTHSIYLSSWGYTLCAMNLQEFYYHCLDYYIADYLCLKNKRSGQ
ncbi:hypothetical protein [Helicobacter canis]|uniref:Uncharacterized protein n=1 Tax=Helicobacter canis NCTC 12740 TaxID=1357399 RepID=V8CG60_9HELI|nr:hypothetical protein [Helicobacter canis]ETD25736.1 hypothetical protein HMPREF2087_01567 [Helicobacter canis NCTC 12740]